MSKAVEFFVEGKPQGKARPRVSKGRMYTPKNTTEYERRIAEAYHGEMMDGAVYISVLALFGIPKSYTKKKKKEIKNGAMPTKKPDIDNIAKVVMDALNGVAYADDNQVVALVTAKYYSEDEEGLWITVMEKGDSNETSKL